MTSQPKDLRGDPPLAPIPRDAADDLAPAAVEARRRAWIAAAGSPAPHVFGAPVAFEAARGKIENFVGFAQVPIGIAGPLRVDTSRGVREVYVPMATTEGAMVASYSRGMRLLASGGGARARVLGEGLTQNPILVYPDAERAAQAAEVATRSFEDLQRIVAGTTRHGRLVALRPEVVGRRLVVSLVFTTGDAIGINMAAAATELCARELASRTGAQERYLHGQDVEKRANGRALVEGRGRRVVADATIPRAELIQRTRATPEALVAIQKSYTVGFAGLGTQNWLVQAANGIAAVMIACGQDAAYVTESATGMLDFDVDAKGDLYASAHLPCLLVGTVGGGSGQGTAAECLALLGCRGEGSANVFAEILAATVLAGDVSLMAAFASHEFVASHEKLGRNRPQG
ncbi:MAG TPA: hydroxymethylglutaryl-CoA reductase [Planctomycetota bacterium]|jgi:hydroxymethylglutaryl-CoA reductase (NADPH)|nr:hydroxymethylglutaryl-CoA reductase [Planctomycetota bacterium]